MSDYRAAALWSSSLTDADADTPCAGCGEQIQPDDRCYAHCDKIWHSDCWPSTRALDARQEDHT